MNYVTARDNLVSQINGNFTTTHPTIPIFYENTTTVDLDTVGDNFVRVQIDFTDAMQADIDMTAKPGQVVYGEALIMIFAKDGTGLRTTLGLVDYFASLMAFENLSGVYVDVPRQGRKVVNSGWMSTSIEVPFRFYSRF